MLPGVVQAFVEAPIYARASGYIKSWSTDIGTMVKKGQVLAEIDSPEIDGPIAPGAGGLRDGAGERRLGAKYGQTLAGPAGDGFGHPSGGRRKGRADAAAKTALLASARANLERLQALESFKHVVAPFDGVVTARRTDIGALINAGSGGPGQELFRVADRMKLRVYVQVPQSSSAAIAVGLPADLRFAEHPGQSYPAKVVRTADAIDPAARTLMVELEVDNAKGILLPGSYTEVHFHLPAVAGAIASAGQTPCSSAPRDFGRRSSMPRAK